MTRPLARRVRMTSPDESSSSVVACSEGRLAGVLAGFEVNDRQRRVLVRVSMEYRWRSDRPSTGRASRPNFDCHT